MHLSENIDFTSAVIGGLMIGASSTALLALLGKISGISGIVGRAVIPCSKSITLSAWMEAHATNASYILGLLGSGYVYMSTNDGFASTTGHGQRATLVTVLSGLMVGFGSRLGSGCVSGHGVCGLPRLSLRSLTAVATFMMTGAVGALVGRELTLHPVSVPGLDALLLQMEDSGHYGHIPAAAVALGVFTAFMALRTTSHLASAGCKKSDDKPPPSPSPCSRPLDHIVHFASAFCFGWGLCVSGMTNADKVRGFLDVSGPDGWDPSLMGVMAGAVGFNLVTFRLLRQWRVVPLCAAPGPARVSLDQTLKYGSDPENMNVNRRLVSGAMVFGLGWGMGGLCPGPSLVQLGTSSPLAQVYIPCLLLGMALQELLLG